MNPTNEELTEFERNARATLQESVLRIDSRVRSRLNQARHAAVEEATKRRPAFWRSLTLMPTAGAVAAALLVVMVFWHREPQGELPPPVAVVENSGHGTTEDLDLLADGEGLDLVEGWDSGFYEWAAGQSDASGNGETDS